MTGSMYDFATVGGVTMSELSVAFLLMRNPKATPATMAVTLRQWFSRPVATEDIAPVLTRMIERSWVEPHPTRAGAYLITETGEDYARNAFGGFVRLVDGGKRRFEVGLLWSLACADAPDDFEN